MRDLDVVLPVHNEKKALPVVLDEWSKVLKKHKLRFSFIICEDGSTDGTKELIPVLRRKYPIILHQKPYRGGYGPSVIDGIVSTHARYVLCIDSDGQCDPNDFSKFWKERKADTVLIGWRVRRADTVVRKIYSRLFGVAFSLLFPGGPHDPSAPYVLFKQEKMLPYLSLLRFLEEGFWWGFIGTCLKHRITVVEIPIHHKDRLDGKTQIYAFSKIPRIAYTNIIGLIKLRFT